MEKVGRWLSVFAIAVVLCGGWMGVAGATGSSTVPEISDPVDNLTGTLLSPEVAGRIAAVLFGVIALSVIAFHLGSGVVAFFFGLMAVVMFIAPEAILASLNVSAMAF